MAGWRGRGGPGRTRCALPALRSSRCARSGGQPGGDGTAPGACAARAQAPAAAPAAPAAGAGRPPRAPAAAEDCLYLNVWTSAEKASDKKPVMVFIYGGGFFSGAGSEARYDSEHMASKGVVAVTINYRLGPFGFFTHPELAKESGHNAAGNYGVMDAIAALQWVKKNIAAFGGDPNNVTVYGESAGAIMIGALAGSPPAKGLFNRVIVESGTWMGVVMAKMAIGCGRDGEKRHRARHDDDRGTAGEAGAPSSRRRDVGESRHRRLHRSRGDVAHVREGQAERVRSPGRIQQGRRDVRPARVHAQNHARHFKAQAQKTHGDRADDVPEAVSGDDR